MERALRTRSSSLYLSVRYAWSSWSVACDLTSADVWFAREERGWGIFCKGVELGVTRFIYNLDKGLFKIISTRRWRRCCSPLALTLLWMKMTEEPVQGFGLFLALELIRQIYGGALWNHDVGSTPTSVFQWMGRREISRVSHKASSWLLLCELPDGVLRKATLINQPDQVYYSLVACGQIELQSNLVIIHMNNDIFTAAIESVMPIPSVWLAQSDAKVDYVGWRVCTCSNCWLIIYV